MAQTAQTTPNDLNVYSILQGNCTLRFREITDPGNYQKHLSALMFYSGLIVKNSAANFGRVDIRVSALRNELIDCACRAVLMVHCLRHGSRVDLMRIESLQADCRRTFEAKNLDYGDSYKTYGSIGVLIRLQDKFRRVQQLSRQDAVVKEESLVDTLLDIYNYCLMAVLLIDRGL